MSSTPIPQYLYQTATSLAHMMASLPKQSNGPSFRADADSISFIARELLAVRVRPYEVQYPELKGLTFVPPDTEPTDPGATHFIYSFEDRIGKAELTSSLANRPPRVDVKREEVDPIPLRSMWDSYAFDVQELRAAAMARRNISAAKANSARKAIMFLHDDILTVGDGTAAYLGLRGLFNLLNTTPHTVANGAAGSKTLELKTGIEIVETFHAICNAIQDGTKGIEQPDTLLLPLSSYTRAATTRIGDGSDKFALDFFNEQRKQINPAWKGCLSSVKLETAGAGGTKRMVAYEKSAEKVARVDPIEFEQMPPQIDGMQTITTCHARTAGVYSPFPKSIAYGDGI